MRKLPYSINVGFSVSSACKFAPRFDWTGQTLASASVGLPGGVQALYTAPGLTRFRFPDWQGSIRAESKPGDRVFSESVAFAPFGERYALKGAPYNVDSFTGKPDQMVSDEYDFPALEEHNAQGRWISPDPMPGTGNKYVYADNNLLSNVDVFGLASVTLDGTEVSSSDWMTSSWDTQTESHSSFRVQTEGKTTPPAANCGWLARIFGCGGGKSAPSSSKSPDFTDAMGKMLWNSLASSYNLMNETACAASRGCTHPANPMPYVYPSSHKEFELMDEIGLGLLFVPGPGELDEIGLLSRDQLLSEITNYRLRVLVDKYIWRAGSTVGDGSTAAAIEEEVATGMPVGGKWHSTKGRESINALRRLMREQNLSPRDKMIARYILNRTEKALGLGGPTI
jgi:RHS repeat-associated protein